MSAPVAIPELGLAVEDPETPQAATSLAPTTWLDQCRKVVVTSLEQLESVRNVLLAAPDVTYDVETTGLRVIDDRIVSMQFAPNGDEAFFIAIDMVDPAFTNLPIQAVVEILRPVFERGVVAHNAGFDWKMTQRYIDFTITADTMLEAKIFDADQRVGLKHQIKAHLKLDEAIPFKSLFSSKVKTADRRFDRVPFAQAVPYACQDVLATWRLHQHYKAVLDPTHMIYVLEHQCIKPLARMELFGVRLDLAKIEEGARVAQEMMNSTMAEIVGHAGRTVELSKPRDVSKLLYEELQLPVLKESEKTGAPSTDAATLKLLLKDHPIIDAIQRYREAEKLKVGFFDPLPAFVQSDGCIHTSYHQYGAGTGRMSASDPNLQQVPKERGKSSDVLRTAIRGSFIPPEGYTGFLDVDFCLAPGTRVLLTDLTWKPVEQLAEGDDVIGFDEDLTRARNGGHCFRSSRVEGTKHLRQPCYRIMTDRGTVISSAPHRWLARRYTASGNRHNREWIASENLKAGDSISFLAAPWDVDHSREAGYLAGFFDGEGFVSSGGVGFGQNPGPTAGRVLQLLREKGFSFAENSQPNKRCVQHRIGGYEQTLRFLGSIRPHRLLDKARTVWEGKQTWGKTSTPAFITAIEYLGEQDVVAVQTSTKTLIAEGFLSHNSQIEYRLFASLSQDRNLLKAYANDWDVHEATAAMMFNVPIDQVDKNLRNRGKSLNFMAIYGGSKWKLAEMLGVEVGEAEGLLSSYWSTLLDAARYCESIRSFARRHGYVETYFGRRRMTPGINGPDRKLQGRAERQSVNSVVQGTAADVMKIALVRLDKALMDGAFKSRLCLTVHDQVVIAFHPGDDLDTLAEVVRAAMEIEVPGWVPMKSEPAFGPTWNDVAEFAYPSRRAAGDPAPVIPVAPIDVEPISRRREVLTIQVDEHTPPEAYARLGQAMASRPGGSTVTLVSPAGSYRVPEGVHVDRQLLLQLRAEGFVTSLSPMLTERLTRGGQRS